MHIVQHIFFAHTYPPEVSGGASIVHGLRPQKPSCVALAYTTKKQKSLAYRQAIRTKKYIGVNRSTLAVPKAILLVINIIVFIIITKITAIWTLNKNNINNIPNNCIYNEAEHIEINLSHDKYN